MDEQDFQNLSVKIEKINKYLSTIEEGDWEAVFANLAVYSTESVIEPRQLGSNLKNTFSDIKIKNDYLMRELSKRPQEEKLFFNEMTLYQKEQIVRGLRSISFHIPKLNNIWNLEDGGEMTNIDQLSTEFISSYNSLISSLAISRLSFSLLNEKINCISPRKNGQLTC